MQHPEIAGLGELERPQERLPLPLILQEECVLPTRSGEDEVALVIADGLQRAVLGQRRAGLEAQDGRDDGALTAALHEAATKLDELGLLRREAKREEEQEEGKESFHSASAYVV